MTESVISPPAAHEYNAYYEQYVGKVPSGDFTTMFAGQPEMLQDLLGNLPAGEDSQLHEPYTWTLKQVIGHLIDVERLFSTRMLRIGVGDETPMPGMDQNAYIDGLNYDNVSMSALLNEFAAIRAANVLLVERMGSTALQRMGTASGHKVSARGNLYIMAGHVEYHAEIIRRRLQKN